MCPDASSISVRLTRSGAGMFRFILLTVIALVVAIGGGAGSVRLALDSDIGLGTVRIGQWYTYPDKGTLKADPYTRARFSREGDLTLGVAEALVFTARSDETGAELDLRCRYSVAGTLPPARFWTLHARDGAGAVVRFGSEKPAGIHSRAVLREADNTVVVTASRAVAPGNWLALAGTGPFELVLTLYDAPIASTARIDDIQLPRITRVDCDD